MAPTIIYYF